VETVAHLAAERPEELGPATGEETEDREPVYWAFLLTAVTRTGGLVE
jgi:hypothetical protein